MLYVLEHVVHLLCCYIIGYIVQRKPQKKSSSTKKAVCFFLSLNLFVLFPQDFLVIAA